MTERDFLALIPPPWRCIRCKCTFTPLPTDPDSTAYAAETFTNDKGVTSIIGEICRPCYEREAAANRRADIVSRNPEDFEPYPEREHAPDGEKCWCGQYHPTDKDIGIHD